jgi:hypothetical protein
MGSYGSSTANKNIVGASWFLITVALFAGAQVQAQDRPRLSPAYAVAAHLALLAIESDNSAAQGDGGTAEETATHGLKALDKVAVTQDEQSMSEVLRQIHQLIV